MDPLSPQHAQHQIDTSDVLSAGNLGSDSDIVAFNPRVDEDVYFELELRRQDRLGRGMRSRIVTTVAFGGPFFHLDGEFDESIAVRNLFAEVQNFLTSGLHLWAGSRMWRGDDVYLLNFWPLDNINTIGGPWPPTSPLAT